MKEALVMETPGQVAQATVGDARDSAPIPDLVAALKRRGVRYCHWKSNVRLADSLSGKEDLDLLVRRSDATEFFAALSDAGFKLARSRDGGGHPGVLHAFALDPRSLRLVHVHAYFQVVTGDSLVKSYHLPFERILLEDVGVRMGLPVPPVEAELLVFLLRIALKHTGPLEFWMVNRHYRAVPEELAWLRQNADEAAARQLWMQHVPGAREDEFDTLIRLVADPARVGARLGIGLRLAWRLREWRRIGFWAASGSRLRRFGLLVGSRLRRRRSVRLVAGGVLVALVGPKASGKSTLGAALGDRLGAQLDLRRIHVGKPPATLLSAPVRVFLPLLRRLLPGERSGQYQTPERRANMTFSYPYLVRMVLLAHDRRALLFRTRRAATEGAIVIADRYPSFGVGAIDGSQFGAAAIAACGSRWKRALMRLEGRLYRDLPKPDLVIRLNAPIQTTLLRDASRNKSDGPDPDSVQRRRDIETMAEFPEIPVAVINTDVPLEQSVSDVVRAVWRGL
ncbi:hypothetical protein [Puniceibacterium confluentis]|uniref:hypothetical protein n=2 Tax=Puniceibacterium confluentis TaxID=1958944 RepID=UPI0011B53A81|nr:hypothetical protein [Puniceibacterium confluentis]